ncbi:hypothetical protein AAFF_G00139560 [Aldrovandia affinis]|uniref:Uncharacterized protein n=1 Tax=Aldrovandia affinis TaxID=143900 RepID=A0AAD7TC51_9TELE|nr:hypothetical protein AAFF_G00139560 [Aldrovandia affinis]
MALEALNKGPQIDTVYTDSLYEIIEVGDPHKPELIHRSIFHLEEEVHLNPSYIYPQLELAVRYSEVQNVERANDVFQKIFTRPDLSFTEQQALHRMYGELQWSPVCSQSTAITQYMEGMKLLNISSDWRKCHTPLLKILRI